MTNGRQLKMLFFELQEIMSAQEQPLGCQQTPELFFPEDFSDKRVREETTTLAKSICRECPIQLECLTYAKQAEEEWGIWGGKTPGERSGKPPRGRQPSSGSKFR